MSVVSPPLVEEDIAAFAESEYRRYVESQLTDLLLKELMRASPDTDIIFDVSSTGQTIRATSPTAESFLRAAVNSALAPSPFDDFVPFERRQEIQALPLHAMIQGSDSERPDSPLQSALVM